jgi:hypothetical protein
MVEEGDKVAVRWIFSGKKDGNPVHLSAVAGPSRDVGDHDDWDRTSRVCCRLGIHGWNGRCVWSGRELMVTPGATR